MTIPSEYRTLQVAHRGAVLFYRWFAVWLVAAPDMDIVLSVWSDVTRCKDYITITDYCLDDCIKALLAAGHKCAIAEPVKDAAKNAKVETARTQGSLFEVQL